MVMCHLCGIGGKDNFNKEPERVHPDLKIYMHSSCLLEMIIIYDKLIKYNIKSDLDKVYSELNELKLYVMSKKQIRTLKQSHRIIKTKDRNYILSKNENKCSICGKQNERKYLHIDHIIPLSKGGNNDFSNLQILCVECNLKKKDYILGNI